MTCTNWRNLCKFVWPTVYLCWIWARNFRDSKWLIYCQSVYF